mgnify:CR=1 FL=1
MSHFAEIDKNNIVVRVLVGNNSDPDEGYQWLIDNLGGTWIKTSYNTYAGIHTLGGTPLRKNYAGVGFTYDKTRDAFIPPKPFDSWVLNEETCHWESPIPMPTDEKDYRWNEETVSWDEIAP